METEQRNSTSLKCRTHCKPSSVCVERKCPRLACYFILRLCLEWCAEENDTVPDNNNANNMLQTKRTKVDKPLYGLVEEQTMSQTKPIKCQSFALPSIDCWWMFYGQEVCCGKLLKLYFCVQSLFHSVQKWTLNGICLEFCVEWKNVTQKFVQHLSPSCVI